MPEEKSERQDAISAESTFRDRMRFLMWLSALRLGTWNSKEFAARVGKRESQISDWVRETPKPGWDIIKSLAVSVRVSPTWLDDPKTPGAEVPTLFPEWLSARRSYRAEVVREAEAASRAKVDDRAANLRDVPTTGPKALAHAVRQTADHSELERRDIPAKRRKRKGA